MRISTEQFERLNIYSNKEMQKLLESIVNESSNAALVNVFEDSVILLDHENGDFYTADYKFDADNLTIDFKNFEKVELFSEDSTLEEKIEQFLDEDEMTSDEIFEVYKNEVLKKDASLKELVDCSISKKSFNNPVNYNEIKEAVEKVKDGFESPLTESYKFYKERLLTHPLTKINYFNFNEDVRVSLVETEPKRVITTSLREKAKDLYKNEEFKDKFIKMAKTFIEDVEEGTEALKALMEDYPCVFTLDEAERAEIFGKIYIRDKELREVISDLNEGFNLVFESMDLAELKNEYMFEEGEEAAPAPEAAINPSEDGDSEDDDKIAPQPKQEPAKEVPKNDANKIADDLEKAVKEISDEKTREYVDGVIKNLRKMGDEGTKPEIVKEAIEILSL